MMRKELAKEEGTRKKFSAIFSRLGKKTNYKGYSEDTILLTNITDMETNMLMTDHVWFSYSKGFEGIKLSAGAKIIFEARIKKYAKGYVNARYKINQKIEDYKLSHPTKIALIE